jgi:hypothetical protein
MWLSLPTARVVRLAREGEIPCLVLPGGDLLFDPSELTEWLRTRRVHEGEVTHAD